MTRARIVLAGLVALSVLLLTTVVWAGSSDNYAIDWSVMSGGGAPAASGSRNVALNGSLGQTAIGPSSEGQVTQGAGFWYGLGIKIIQVFLPILLKSN